MNNLCSKPEYRPLLATTLLDPGARKMFAHLKRMGAHSMRPDSMLVLNKETGKYDQKPDLGAWYAHIGNTKVCALMLLHKDGQWALHEC